MPRTTTNRSIPFLLLGAALLALPSCFLYGTGSVDGGQLFRRERCIDCHGPDGLGTGNGPSLDGMASYWTKAELTNYLIDPESVLPSKPRLAAIADSHDARMAAFGHLTESERRALATFVLKIHQ